MKKILVVDDDASILNVVKIILQKNNYDVLTHDNSLSIPKIVKKYEPNLVLLDVGLPGKSGVEICKELKAISKTPPIILFSAHADALESCNLCKADGFIHKPFDIPIFLETINNHVA